LYLPTSWTDDRERCRRAGIDDSVAFETKVAMAKAMVRKAIADRIPFAWVTADAAYGFSKGWRFELEQADVFHVMATTRHDTASPAGPSTIPSTTCSPVCRGRSGSAVPAARGSWPAGL
jgi:FOG: Transposase